MPEFVPPVIRAPDRDRGSSSEGFRPVSLAQCEAAIKALEKRSYPKWLTEVAREIGVRTSDVLEKMVKDETMLSFITDHVPGSSVSFSTYKEYRPVFEKLRGKEISYEDIGQKFQPPKKAVGVQSWLRSYSEMLDIFGISIVSSPGKPKGQRASKEKPIESRDYPSLYKSAIERAAILHKTETGRFPEPGDITPEKVQASVRGANFSLLVVRSYLFEKLKTDPNFIAAILDDLKSRSH